MDRSTNELKKGGGRKGKAPLGGKRPIESEALNVMQVCIESKAKPDKNCSKLHQMYWKLMEEEPVEFLKRYEREKSAFDTETKIWEERRRGLLAEKRKRKEAEKSPDGFLDAGSERAVAAIRVLLKEINEEKV